MAKEYGLYTAIMLGEIISKYLYYRDRKMLIEDDYFYSTIEEMEEDTTLKRFKQDEAIKVLEDIGLIQIKAMGFPAKRHFKINEEALISHFVGNKQTESTLSVTNKLISRSPTNNTLYINNTKNNKKEEISKKISQTDEGENDLMSDGKPEYLLPKEEKPVEELFPAFLTSKPAEFVNSIAFDLNVFKAAMKKEEMLGVDILYYRNLVDEWCEKLSPRDKRKKRTSRGWIATARQFMRSDNEKGKMKTTGVQKEMQEESMKYFLSL